MFPDAWIDPQQDPQVPVVLLQVRDTVSIRHVHQHLFGRSELLSGHTNRAKMLAALFLASLGYFEERGDVSFAPASGVAVLGDSEDALVADGAVEVLLDSLFECTPALVPRTCTRFDHFRQFLGVRTPVRQAMCQLFEVLDVVLI